MGEEVWKARITELEDELAQSIIEKLIFERASLDGDNRIVELKARIKILEEGIEKHKKQIEDYLDNEQEDYSKEWADFDEELYKILRKEIT
jgi:capsule polysaccharide export protein KpsE/RkpR